MRCIPKNQTAEAQAALSFFAKQKWAWDEIMRQLRQGNAEALAHYAELKASLAMEQCLICCYCEREIDPTSSECHIEHVKPRSKYPQHIFDYDNLACACNGRHGVDRHCGHSKAGRYDDALFVAPHKQEVEQLFAYDSEGGITAASTATEQQAEHMVKELGLRCTRLTGMRRGHGKGLVETIPAFLDGSEEGFEMLRDFARSYLEVAADGKLHPFYSLSNQVLGPFLTSTGGGQ